MKAFEGVLFDLVDEVLFERSSVLRATYAEALADARGLIQYHAERACDADCFVLADGALIYGPDEA